MLLILMACTTSLAEGDSGSIALMPFFSEEFDIQGVVPVACNQGEPGDFECPDLTPAQSPAYLFQKFLPGTLDELIPLLLDDLSLKKLPEPNGSYKGMAFTWDLFTFEAQIWDLGPEIFRLDLALTEDGERAYLVALVTLPDDYNAHAPLYDTVFTHAVYALAPLD
jgi:hypothetical protein